MSLSDPLGDMLTRIRNAQRARQTRCVAPASRLRDRCARRAEARGLHPRLARRAGRPGVSRIEIELKYSEGEPAIKEITRISKPGRRVYSKIKELPKVYNGPRHLDPVHAPRRDERQ